MCKPDISNPYSLCRNYSKTYIIPDEDFKCLGIPKHIDESRLSFPSGHSSLSFYSMTFLIIFINQTWNCRSMGLLPRIFQVLLFSLAFYVGLSRIVDNKHHPTDVIGGALIGILIAIITSFYLIRYLKRTNYKGRYYAVSTSSNEDLIQNERTSSYGQNFTILNELPTSNKNLNDLNNNHANDNNNNNNNNNIETIDGSMVGFNKNSRLIQNGGTNRTVNNANNKIDNLSL